MEVKCSNLTISMTKPSGIAAFGLEITKNSSHLKDIINSDPLILEKSAPYGIAALWRGQFLESIKGILT